MLYKKTTVSIMALKIGEMEPVDIHSISCTVCLQVAEEKDVRSAVATKEEEVSQPSCSSVHMGGWNCSGTYC